MKKSLLAGVTICSLGLGLATGGTTSLAADTNTVNINISKIGYANTDQLISQKNGMYNKQMCPLEGCGGGNFGLVGHQSGDPQHPGPMPHF